MFWQTDNVSYYFGLWMIPIVSAVLSVVSMIVTNKINAKVLGTEKVVDQSQRTTMIIMPLFSLWICFTLPAALGVYWIGNSIVAILQEIANMPFLKKHLVKLEAEKAERKEAEKERVKQEKKAQAEAKKKAAEEMRRIQMERKLNKSISGASREGLRAYARGRMYDPDRYPTFPYQDPNELIKEKLARMEAEKAAGKGKKGKKDKDTGLPLPPTQEIPKDEAVPATAPAAEPEAPVTEEPEEGFVEESFLEEPETTEE
jgi:YidC/Oxa1 family membrane protein insertase